MYEIYEQLLQKLGVSSYRVCKETGIAQSVISSWKAGISSPKHDKLKKLADYFGVSVEYLLTGKEPTDGYYVQGETAEVAQQIFEDKELRALFDAAKGARPEDVRMAAEMLRRFKATNPGG